MNRVPLAAALLGSVLTAGWTIGAGSKRSRRRVDHRGGTVKSILMLVSLFFFGACDDGIPSARPPPRTPDSATSERTALLHKRAQAAIATASDAVEIDGTTAVRIAFNAYSSCPLLDEHPVADPDLVAALAKCAVLKVRAATKEMERYPDAYQNDVDVAISKAEELADLAMEAAKKRGAAKKRTAEREAEQESASKTEAVQYEKDNAAFQVAQPICEKDFNLCKRKCDAEGQESGAYCAKLATILADKQKYDEAKAASEKACNVGFYTSRSCPFVAKMEAAKAGLESKRNSAFSDVVSIADGIASKIFLANTVSSMGGRRASQVPRMRLVISADIKETYCPAQKAAFEILGVQEFNRRAAAHCKDQPPSAIGLRGSEVNLPNECRSVFASACP